MLLPLSPWRSHSENFTHWRVWFNKHFEKEIIKIKVAIDPQVKGQTFQMYFLALMCKTLNFLILAMDCSAQELQNDVSYTPIGPTWTKLGNLRPRAEAAKVKSSKCCC